MRKLSELIVLVRGGGEVGSAIAHRLYRSRFRICLTETANPLAASRGSCFSEAVYDGSKTIEDVVAERAQLTLDSIYRLWRKGSIPVVIDPELAVKPLIKPDVLINAMMLGRETSTRMTDAPLVIGIGPGFTAGSDVHLVIESKQGNNLGKIIFEGTAEDSSEEESGNESLSQGKVIRAEEAGIFTTERSIGEAVLTDETIGKLNDTCLTSPISGVIRGLLRNESRVLANTRLFEIDSRNDRSACFSIRDSMRSIAGGVLEAVMMSFNHGEVE